MRDERPLSQAQRAQWFLYRLAPEATAYNTGVAAGVHGGLDLARLHAAVAIVSARHDLLRSTFAERGGRPVRTVHSGQLTKLAVRPAGQVREALAAPFRLESAGAFRVVLTGEVLLVAGHHIATDAVSNALLLRDLLDACTGAELPPPPASYDEEVVAEQRFVAEPGTRELATRLRRGVAGATVGRLPTDRPRPGAPSLTGATHQLTAPPVVVAELRERARDLGVTPFVLLATVLQAALFHRQQRPDFLIGAPVTMRRGRASREAIGNYINTVVLRAQLSPDTSFREAAARTDARLREQVAGVRYPFPLLANSFGNTALYRVGLNLLTPGHLGTPLGSIVDTTNPVPVRYRGLTVSPVRLPQQEGQLDLMVDVLAGAGGLAIDLRYDTALFDAATIERFAAEFRALLDAALAQPDAPIGTEREPLHA